MRTESNGDGDQMVLAARKGKIFTIQLCRPSRANSLIPPMLDQLEQALVEANNDERVRVIIITGTGDNFTTGMDVNYTRGFDAADIPGLTASMERRGAQTTRLITTGKVTIAAINGRAMGMGVVYSIASDFRFAASTATFKMPEIDSSIYPAALCVTLMVQQIGLLRTKEILMRCKAYTADEFLQLGFLNETVPPDALEDHVSSVAREISRKNPDVLRMLKLHANHVAFLQSMEQASDLERDAFHYPVARNKCSWLEKIAEKYGVDLFPRKERDRNH